MYSKNFFFGTCRFFYTTAPPVFARHAGAVRSRGCDNSPNCLASQKFPLKPVGDRFLHDALFAPDCARSLSATPTFFVGLVPRPTNGLLRRRCPNCTLREARPIMCNCSPPVHRTYSARNEMGLSSANGVYQHGSINSC